MTVKRNYLFVPEIFIVIVLIFSLSFILFAKPKTNIVCEKLNHSLETISNGTTIDTMWQDVLTKNIEKAIEETSSQRGMAIAVDMQSGEIKSLVSINPNPREGDCDGKRNLATIAWEPGSVVKPLLVSAAINEGVVNTDTKLIIKDKEKLTDNFIVNTQAFPSLEVDVSTIVQKSINTGVIAVLRRLGNNDIDQKARSTWHSYLTDKYNFGKNTKFGMADEDTGYVPEPNGLHSIKYRYASTSFGVGLTATPVQLVNSYISILNEGLRTPATHLYRSTNHYVDPAIQAKTSQHITEILVKTFKGRNIKMPDGYVIGGKSGTASTPDDYGTYKVGIDHDIGTFIGFIGKDKPRYIIMVRLDEPKTISYASTEAANAWAQSLRQLISNKLIK